MSSDKVLKEALWKLSAIAEEFGVHSWGLPVHNALFAEQAMDVIRPFERQLCVDAEERLFRQRFVANFLSSWCAKHYDEACNSGKQEILSKPPVEDAVFLAGKAWEKMKRLFA